MPMTPFIGVRISWLMLARKSDLSRDASVALSRASDHGRLGARLGGDVGEGADPARDAAVAVRDGLRVTSTIRGPTPGVRISNRWQSSPRYVVAVGQLGGERRRAARRR